MPEENSAKTQATIPPQNDTPAQEGSSDAQASNMANDTSPAPKTAPESASTDILVEVARKIGESQNVLIALSSDPSVDEMAAAIGLSLFLDKMGKRATAIYSGSTPNALEFLKPEETFESTTDTLQDFVIALNKEKADHLRYKLDGDYVKIYITPYKTRVAEEDLDFSYGDYNVDLVLALDVANGADLDSALREHGRIMHDASIVNITTGNPGKLGEIEWSDKAASSVSEMIAKLIYSLNSKVQMGEEEATAFLTGIVAATNRFSNNSTTPETMKMSSRLMESGANQQLISNNITPDMENEMINMIPAMGENKPQPNNSDPTKLDIEHSPKDKADESKEVDTDVTKEDKEESAPLDGLEAAEADLSQAGAETTPEVVDEPLKVDDNSDIDKIESEMKAEEEKSDQPSIDLGASAFDQEDTSKYGEMLENALEGAENSEPVEPTTPVMSDLSDNNPATTNVPKVPTAPEVNEVPYIDYMPMPDDQVLPPPPAPPIDMNAVPAPDMGGGQSVEPTAPTASVAPIAPAEPIEPAAPTTLPTPESLGGQPAMQDQVYAPQVSDPGAFKIPGA